MALPNINTDDCWLAAKNITKTGYSNIKYWLNGRCTSINAHRAMYEQTYGWLPKELVVDHLCGVRNCINPLHLQAIPQRANIKRRQFCRHCGCFLADY